MATWKVIAQKLMPYWLLAVVAVLCSSVTAAESEWQTLTSFKEVRRMRLIDDTLYVVTSGGLLAVHGTNQQGVTYTNTNGLSTTNITDIIADEDGQKWITDFGRLMKFEGANSKHYLFNDDNNELILLHCVVDDGENLWVGTDIGLVLFSKTIDGGQIQDSYSRFGDLADFPAIYDILLEGDSIWLATSSGLAVADRTDPIELKSPSRWTVYGSDVLFGVGTVNRIVAFESDYYLTTTTGLLRLQVLPEGPTITQVPLVNLPNVTDLKIENDSLFFYYRLGIGTIIGSAVVYVPTSELLPNPVTGTNTGLFRWVAISDGGVYHDSSGSFTEYVYTGLPGNHVSDVTVNTAGLITASFSEKPPAQFIDGLWRSYEFWVSAGTTDLVTDSTGRAWAGTEGNGLWLLDGGVAINYDENNSTLRGNSDDPPNGEAYVFVEGLTIDRNYLYAVCYRAVNDYPVAIADLTRLDDPWGWDSLGTDDGLTTAFVRSVDYHAGRLAVGADRDPGGVFLCQVGYDPFNRLPDACVHFTEDNSYLLSDVVRVVRFSPDGILWVGTNSGLSRYDPGYERFVDVELPPGIDLDITDLEFDSRGNLWIGTRRGLARMDATTGEFEVFSNLNSDLVDDGINSLNIDPFTGKLYVATDYGISIRPTTSGRPVFDVDQVVAIPNPFVIRSDNDRLEFNFAEKAIVRIYSVAGELIREMDTNTLWAGRNQQGKMVASGVYIFILTDKTGNIGRGKVLLVRE